MIAWSASTVACTRLVSIAALGLPCQATGVATTRKFIRERTDVVRRYIKPHIEAVHRFNTDRETSLKVLAKALALSDKQLLERTYDGAIVEHKLPAKQYPTLEGLKTFLAGDPKAKGAKAEDFVDLRFIKELDDSVYHRYPIDADLDKLDLTFMKP